MTNTRRRSVMMEMFETDNGWRDGARQVVAFYIDGGKKLGEAMLDLHQNYTSWARDTPLWSIFEAQRNTAKRMLEDTVALNRKLWRIEKEA
jgi:hypothetical protein